MTFAALADIHGNVLALEAVLADIGRRGLTRIVNLGDLLSGPLWPAETADRLQPISLSTIAGNHERQLLTLPYSKMGLSDQYTTDHLSKDHLSWLGTLPATLTLDDIFLCHGTPTSDLAYFLHDVRANGVYPSSLSDVGARATVDARLILCGHTHVPGQVRLDDGRLIVNPGSVGLPAYTDDVPFLHAMEAGTPHARYAVLSQQGGEWHAEPISLAYDWEAAARQAERNHRADWAVALRSGLAKD